MHHDTLLCRLGAVSFAVLAVACSSDGTPVVIEPTPNDGATDASSKLDSAAPPESRDGGTSQQEPTPDAETDADSRLDGPPHPQTQDGGAAQQQDPVVLGETPPAEDLCNGSPSLRLGYQYFNSSPLGVDGLAGFMNANGVRFLLVNGQCRYWVSDDDLELGVTRTGMLSPTDQRALRDDVSFGAFRTLADARPSLEDAGGATYFMRNALLELGEVGADHSAFTVVLNDWIRRLRRDGSRASGSLRVGLAPTTTGAVESSRSAEWPEGLDWKSSMLSTESAAGVVVPDEAAAQLRELPNWTAMTNGEAEAFLLLSDVLPIETPDGFRLWSYDGDPL